MVSLLLNKVTDSGGNAMNISQAEQAAIIQVLVAGGTYGYGNMISHLQTAWAKRLVDEWGMTEDGARRAAGGPGYPFEMHEDLIKNGQWDETGKRYRQRK